MLWYIFGFCSILPYNAPVTHYVHIAGKKGFYEVELAETLEGRGVWIVESNEVEAGRFDLIRSGLQKVGFEVSPLESDGAAFAVSVDSLKWDSLVRAIRGLEE